MHKGWHCAYKYQQEVHLTNDVENTYGALISTGDFAPPGARLQSEVLRTAPYINSEGSRTLCLCASWIDAQR